MKIISESGIKDNVFNLIGKDWMLITGGNPDAFNTMTASWGGMGVLWNKNVTFCFIRPQRHTFGFMEENEYYTLSFFDETYRKILNYCGKYSGRDYDKVKENNLTPYVTKNKAVAFEEARLIIECKKIYADLIRPENFILAELDKNYAKKDYHRFYVGEVTSVYQP